jgi:Protein of unknown function (DUF3592)
VIGPSGVRAGALLTLAGAVMVAFGGYGLCEFIGYPGETTGAARVVTVEGARLYPHYEVSFTTADGRAVTARTSLRRGPRVEAGDQLPIAYRPGDPQDVRVRHQKLSTLGPLTGLVGLFLMLNGVVALVRGIRRR